MIILITETGYLPETNEMPIPGHKYYLEDASEYTPPMRRLWESLVDIAFKSGLFSYDTMDISEFREHFKLDYGEGFSRLKYVNDKNQMVEVKHRDDIPDYVALDFANGNRERIQGIIKSSTAYTKKQFTRMIDNTIDAMHNVGVDSKKFADIIDEITREKKA